MLGLVRDRDLKGKGVFLISNKGKKMNSDKDNFKVDEPFNKIPEPVKIVAVDKPQAIAPIENLIKEAKVINSQIPPVGKVVSYTKLEQIKSILKGGGMDSMSVDKSLIKIKEVVEI